MAGITEVPTAMKKKTLSQTRGSEEKRWMIEDAARTLKRLAEIKREIKEIKTDKPLFAAAREVLKQEIADTKKAMAT